LECRIIDALVHAACISAYSRIALAVMYVYSNRLQISAFKPISRSKAAQPGGIEGN